MGIIRGTVTQGGADTFTSDMIDTNLSVDGKSGWQILAMKCFWSNGYSLAAIDCTVNGLLSTKSTITTMDESEELTRINYAVQNTGGVAVAFPLEQIKSTVPLGERITVQPALYFHVASAGSGQANILSYEIEYEIVKLTELEIMRLLVGGA